MKRMLKKVLKRRAWSTLEYFKSGFGSHPKNEAAAQKMLMQQYRLLSLNGHDCLPNFEDVGFRKYSQFEEDGILLYIFSLISPINRICVEICAGDGHECNTTNLIINHGWWGHLFDGDQNNVKSGEVFFSQNKDTFLYPPQFKQAWITAENVNEQISRSGASGVIDLLSLDIDGMDYWVWKAINVVTPRVVLCETQNYIPPDQALTVPYDPEFVFESENFRGASLAAMCKLGREKGYRLIGTHRFGFNAFFMKDGVGEAFFPEVDVASCMGDSYSKLAHQERWLNAQKYDWQKI